MADYIDRHKAIDALMAQSSSDGAYGYVDSYTIGLTLVNLPSAEITEEDVREWCYKRGLTIIDNALYLEMKRRWSASAEYTKTAGSTGTTQQMDIFRR